MTTLAALTERDQRSNRQLLHNWAAARRQPAAALLCLAGTPDASKHTSPQPAEGMGADLLAQKHCFSIGGGRVFTLMHSYKVDALLLFWTELFAHLCFQASRCRVLVSASGFQPPVLMDTMDKESPPHEKPPSVFPFSSDLKRKSQKPGIITMSYFFMQATEPLLKHSDNNVS